MSHHLVSGRTNAFVPPIVLTVLAVVAGSLLMTIAAKVQIPFYPVPMSLQTLVAIGLGLTLGPARGAASVLLYLSQGMVGLPVFAGTPPAIAGLAYMAGPTGGYLAGFVLAALVAGGLARMGFARRALGTVLCALIAGAVVYLPGLAWLGQFTGYNAALLHAGLFPFVAGDLIKALIIGLASARLGARKHHVHGPEEE